MTDYIDIPEDEAKQRLADLEWTGGGKKPLYSQVMTGYMLAKALWFFNFFIDKAISCIDQAVIDMNADDVPTENVEAYEIKALLREAQASAYRLVGEAHRLSASKMQEKGYGKITTRIFKLLKIGVVRK